MKTVSLKGIENIVILISSLGNCCSIGREDEQSVKFVKVEEDGNNLKILGVNGNIYTLEEYLKLPGNTYHYAVGIVFEFPIIGKRVLAFNSWKEKWGNRETLYTEIYSEAEAVQVMSGLEDTRRIVEAQVNTDDMTAAKRCWEYKDCGLQWYLPSLMELGVIYTLRDEINKAMERLGCDSDNLLPTENSDEPLIWSSSESSQFLSWYVNFYSGYFNYNGKCYTLIVRAVAMLPEKFEVSPDFEEVSPTLGKTYIVPNIKDLPDAGLATELRNRGYKGELTKEALLIV